MSVFDTAVKRNKLYVDSQLCQDAATAIGAGTNASLSKEHTHIVLQVTGAGVGTIIPEISAAGSNWFTKPIMNMETGELAIEIDCSTVTTWIMEVTGMEAFRARISAYTSGSITANAYMQSGGGGDASWMAETSLITVTNQDSTAATDNGTQTKINRRYGLLYLLITEAGVATITPESTLAGSNWFTQPMTNLETGEVVASIDCSSVGSYVAVCNGALAFRARISAYTSGNVTANSYLVRSGQPDWSMILDDMRTAMEAVQAAVEDADTGYTPLGSHQTDSTISSATTITPEANSREVHLQAFTQNVRYTTDGTTPTASVGLQIIAGDKEYIRVGDGAVIKVIEETTSASVQWQCYG